MFRGYNLKHLPKRILYRYSSHFEKLVMSNQSTGPVESSIRSKLTQKLNAEHIEVVNESYMHNVPERSETHFKVLIVSEKFKDLPLIKRHRLVNDILREELQSGVHALSIVTKTNDQWESSNKTIEPSPNCRGGFGK